MADQQGQSSAKEQVSNPLDKIFNNKDCTMCKTHTFMINRLTKNLNELKEDYQADRNSKRKKLEKRKAEIETLKERCSHLEEVIEHIRSLTQSSQAEASTKANIRKGPLPDDSANQNLP